MVKALEIPQLDKLAWVVLISLHRPLQEFSLRLKASRWPPTQELSSWYFLWFLWQARVTTSRPSVRPLLLHNCFTNGVQSSHSSDLLHGRLQDSALRDWTASTFMQYKAWQLLYWKKSKSPHKTNGWTMIMLPCKILRIRTRRSQMVKALEIPQLDKLAWVVLISLHRPLQEFSLRLKASRWPPTQEQSSWYFLWFLWQARVTTSRPSVRPLLLCFTNGVQSSHSSDLLHGRLQDSALRDWTASTFTQYKAWQLLYLKKSKSPQKTNGWTMIMLPCKILRIRTRRSQMVKALEIPQLDKLAWVVLISLHRPLQEFSLRLKASRWPPTQEQSSWYFLWFLWQAGVTTSRPSVRPLLLHNCFTNGVQSSHCHSSDLLHDRLQDSALRDWTASTFMQYKAWQLLYWKKSKSPHKTNGWTMTMLPCKILRIRTRRSQMVKALEIPQLDKLAGVVLISLHRPLQEFSLRLKASRWPPTQEQSSWYFLWFLWQARVTTSRPSVRPLLLHNCFTNGVQSSHSSDLLHGRLQGSALRDWTASTYMQYKAWQLLYWKKSKSPHKTNGWTMIMLPCKILRIRTRRSQMVKALEIPQLDKLAWVVLISLHRPLQEFSLRLKASRWPPTQEQSSWYFLWFLWQARVTTSRPSVRPLLLHNCFTNGVQSSHSSDLLHGRLQDSALRDWTASTFMQYKAWQLLCWKKSKSSQKTNGWTMIMLPCKILRMRMRRSKTAKHLRSCILTH